MEFASTLTETVRFRAQVVRMLADRLPTVPESSSIQTYLPSIVTESSLTEPDIARGLILSGWTAAVPVRTDPPSARMDPSRFDTEPACVSVQVARIQVDVQTTAAEAPTTAFRLPSIRADLGSAVADVLAIVREPASNDGGPKKIGTDGVPFGTYVSPIGTD